MSIWGSDGKNWAQGFLARRIKSPTDESDRMPGANLIASWEEIITK